jgi:hypothetical protein
MNGRKLIPGVACVAVLGILGALGACAHAPQTQEMSILDAIENHRSSVGPASCAALNAAAVCEKSTRLDRGRNCGCVDPRSIAGGQAIQL